MLWFDRILEEKLEIVEMWLARGLSLPSWYGHARGLVSVWGVFPFLVSLLWLVISAAMVDKALHDHRRY